MKKSIVLLMFLVSIFSSVIRAETTFDPATNVLSIDSVTIPGDTVYYDVVVRLDQFTVLSVGSWAPIDSGVSEVCGPADITYDKYNSIQIGMTLVQVKQIIGCEPSVSTGQLNELVGYIWYNNPNVAETTAAISVTFDYPSITATNLIGPAFKRYFAE